MDASLARIPPSLDDAARSLGAGAGRRAAARPSAAAAGRARGTALVLVFVETMKEMPATLLLRPFGLNTLAMEVWERTSEAMWQEAAVPALAIVLAGLVPRASLVDPLEPRRRWAEGETMTSRRPFVVLALTVTVCLAGASDGGDAHAGSDTARTTGGSVTVEFVEPSRYVDARARCSDTEPTGLDELAQLLRAEGARRLPTGWTLTVAVTELDRAGALEPWRGPQFCWLRIMRDVYPPRIDVRFAVTDAQGERRREGRRELRDLNYLQHAAFPDSDPLRYEKALLREWLRAELEGLLPS